MAKLRVVKLTVTPRDTTLSVARRQAVIAAISDTAVGADGANAAEGFESISQNLSGFPSVVVRDGGGQVTGVVFSLGMGLSILKSLVRTSGQISSIVLSGDLPVGIPTTKTFIRDASGIASWSYS